MGGVSRQAAERTLADVVAEHREALDAVASLSAPLAKAADAIAKTFASGGRLLACGNGGSAADAQHIAAEFVGRYLKERAPFSAIALHANTSAVTAIGNDYGFTDVFSRQVRAHGRPGDVLLAISTSGSSHNVLRAVDEAHAVGMTVVTLSGGSGGALAQAGDICLTVPVSSTPRVQEMHILLGHALCGLVEDALS
jgi:D-sedoheptulose 7-phosphate isomerase